MRNFEKPIDRNLSECSTQKFELITGEDFMNIRPIKTLQAINVGEYFSIPSHVQIEQEKHMDLTNEGLYKRNKLQWNLAHYRVKKSNPKS